MISPLPKIVLGTLPFGGVVTESDSHLLIEQALAGGVTAFDVSHLYGEGKAVSVVRSALKGVDQAQVWCSVGLEKTRDENGVFAVELVSLTGDEISNRTYDVLEALDRSQLSLLNIHAFDETTPIELTLNALSEMKKSGLVERVSYSNLSQVQAREIISTDHEGVIDLVQLHGNVLERRLINGPGLTFQDAGRGVACFRTLARGLLTREYSPSNPHPAQSRATRGWRLNHYLNQSYLEGLVELRSRLAAEDIQVVDFALSWLLHGGIANTAIVGVRDAEQLEGILSWVNSTSESVRSLDIEEAIPVKLRSVMNSLPLDHFEK